MKTLIKYELHLSRKILLIWMGMVLLLCGFAYFEHLSLRYMMDDLMKLVDSFPEILKITFGVTGDLTTALGWYGCMYFWAATLDFSYAAYLGAICVAKEKERGTAEYLFTKPVSRNRIVLAKAAASTLNLLLLSVFSGFCNFVAANCLKASALYYFTPLKYFDVYAVAE